MKFAYMFSALAVAATLTACANHHSNNSSTQAAAPDPYGIATLSVAQQQPSVTGTINIRQRIALPPDAVLTVTLSDASLADAPARVLSQKAVRTEGKQAPFNFALPYKPGRHSCRPDAGSGPADRRSCRPVSSLRPRMGAFFCLQ